MEAFEVVGGARLRGSVRVFGAKNSVLKLMAAALLAEGRTVLSNVPNILDVQIMSELLRRLGCTVEHDTATDVVTIDVPATPGHVADYDLVRRMRASIAVLGPLVARVGRADVAVPGGDAIGARGLDMHFGGLRQLGATVHGTPGFVVAEAPDGLQGGRVSLDFPSVGATENIVMAAVLAKGRTVLDNAAREPEIVDLCRMLASMGARIQGAGSSTITVHGVAGLRPVEHEVVPDRIVAGTWAVAAVMTRGDITVEHAVAAHLDLPLDKLRQAGARVQVQPDGFRVVMDRRPRAVDIVTLPYPGFPTDLQPQFIALDAVADGTALVTENLFEARFRFVHELGRMGADVRTDGHHALINGVPRLRSADVEAPDIRAGASLVLAGLLAEGVTTVWDVAHIDRGYAGFLGQIQALGAEIRRIEGPGAPAHD